MELPIRDRTVLIFLAFEQSGHRSRLSQTECSWASALLRFLSFSEYVLFSKEFKVERLPFLGKLKFQELSLMDYILRTVNLMNDFSQQMYFG